MSLIGPKDHGPTNVMQITFVFNRDGELKGCSGYERDHAGATYGQWRTATETDAARAELLKEVSHYLLERCAAIGRDS